MDTIWHIRPASGLPPKPPQPALRRSEGVVVHCTGGHRPASPEEVTTRLRRIHAAHVRGRGWVDVGYHFAVDAWGGIWELLGWGTVGRHAKTSPRSLNLRSHGVVVLGHGTEMTCAEKAALAAFVEEHDRRYGDGFVVGHRDVSRKSCPGDAVYDGFVVPLGRQVGWEP